MRSTSPRVEAIGRLALLAVLGCGPAGEDDGAESDVGSGTSDGVDLDCPDDLRPELADLRDRVIHRRCGTDGTTCHSTEGAVYSGGMDLERDPYVALLGADGTGASAHNSEGSIDGLLRVRPGDPDGSFLMIKLGIEVGNDPDYGSGMPFDAPGSLCDGVKDAFAAWIQAGALP